MLCAQTRPPGHASDIFFLTAGAGAGGVMAVVVACDPHATQYIFMATYHLLQYSL
jgi:hypothetical protein